LTIIIRLNYYPPESIFKNFFMYGVKFKHFQGDKSLMKKSLTLLITLGSVLILTTYTFAGDWERCSVCHKDSGKPAPSKEQLLIRFKTVEEFVHAGKTSGNRMMSFVKTNEELLESVAKEIGIGEQPEPPVEAESVEAFDVKQLVEKKCNTSCHSINRVANAPKHTTSEWFHILAKMEAHQEGLLTPEEMMMLVNWLYSHHHELATVPEK
jgi:hypothetical protein